MLTAAIVPMAANMAVSIIADASISDSGKKGCPVGDVMSCKMSCRKVDEVEESSKGEVEGS